MTNPRQEIEKMIRSDNLEGLLRKCGELHGHYCGYSALGVKAAQKALKELSIIKSTGMEHILTIVETNNCFSDGVQLVTGCSFGNNALIYRDYGKTAMTLLKREGQGIRFAVRANMNEILEEKYPKVARRFRAVQQARNSDKRDEAQSLELNEQAAFALLAVPVEELMTTEKVTMKPPAGYSRIYNSVICSECGESVIPTRVVTKGNMSLCIPCSNQGYYQLDWSGILKHGTS